MSASIEELIERLASDSRCEVEWRDSSVPLVPPGHYVPHIPLEPSPPNLGVILPADMLHFRNRIRKANIFAKSVQGGILPEPNGWNLWNIDFWGFDSLLDELSFYEPGSIWDQFSQCYRFANSASDGGRHLAVDLRTDHYGYIVECYCDQVTVGGDVPVVAHSFSEWLERTLDAGPLFTNGYWEEPGFSDYGSALDGDPCYQSRPCHPLGATARNAEQKKRELDYLYSRDTGND